MDRPIGSIMTVVAVFDTHMLMNAVAAMNPPTIRAGRMPAVRTVTSAMRRCNPQRCMARASMNPPMKRKMRSLA